MANVLENYAVLLRKATREGEAEKLEARTEAIRLKHIQDKDHEKQSS